MISHRLIPSIISSIVIYSGDGHPEIHGNPLTSDQLSDKCHDRNYLRYGPGAFVAPESRTARLTLVAEAKCLGCLGGSVAEGLWISKKRWILDGNITYPLVNLQKTMENHNF